jgi:hypothetical protein
MTQTDVYIGRLSDGPDPLDWGGDYRIGNVPHRLGPFFPPSRGGTFHVLIGKIREKQYVGKQVDWGAWAATVTKDQILEFIEEVYQGDRTYLDPSYMPHLHPHLEELKVFVRSLPDRTFALVASEL